MMGNAKPKIIVKSKNGVDCYFTERLIGKTKIDISWYQSAGEGKSPFFAESKDVVRAAYGTWGQRWPNVPIVDDAKQRVDPNYIALFSRVENRNLFKDQMVMVDFSQHPAIKSVYAAYREFAKKAEGKQLFKSTGMNTGTPKAGGIWKWDYNHTGQVAVNKTIQNVLVNTFKQVFLKCIEIKYYIWSVQTLCYRTKSTKVQKMYFDELQSGQPVPFDDLSNHSLGLAIDINASTNWDGDTIWDIPVEIVKIFRENGFWWGGEYKSRYDTMHFEYKLPFVSDTTRPVCLPFSPTSSLETPAKYYKQNESGSGGFYPAGLNQNLHAGIHLPAEKDKPEVRCMTHGYIVAARLMGAGQAGDNAVLQKFIGNHHLGFLLVRHEVEKVVADGKSDPFPLFSLYMHLAPARWDDPEDLYVKNVPWFKKILEMSHGGVVDLDPSSATVGKNLWAAETVQVTAAEFRVSGGKVLKAESDGKKTAFSKPAPDDVKEALAAFRDGHMVTFDSAVLPVSAGELVGYVQPRTGSSPAVLHWEIFSPAEKSGLDTLKSIDPDVAKLFQRISETRKDNFFEMPKPDGSGTNELDPLLVDKLPAGDRSFMKDIISTDLYMQKLKDFFNKAKSFSDESLDDAKTAETFTYPVSVSIKNPYSYSGPASNGPVTVNVSFKKNGKPVKGGTLTISDFNAMNFNIQVPADADTLCLQSEECFFEPIPLSDLRPPPSAETILKPLVPYRWRNILLSHVTEWKSDGLNPLLDMLDKNKYLDPFLDMCTRQKNELVQKGLVESGDEGIAILKKVLLPIMWWGKQIDPGLKIYGGEHAVCGEKGSEKSIFGMVVPNDGKIDSMHPVTAVWLLQTLEAAGKIKILGRFPVATFARVEDNGKLCWKGWVATSPSPLTGDTVHFVAIQHGYGSGTPVHFSASEAKSARPFELGTAETLEGVAVVSKQLSVWGTVVLKVNGADGKALPADDPGDPKLVVAIPKLQNDELKINPPEAKSAIYTGAISFDENCPRNLEGFLYLRYWTASKGAEPDYAKSGTTYAKTLPVSCSPAGDEKKTVKGVQYKGDFVIGGKGPLPGVKKFDISDFQNVYKGEKKNFMVYLPLCLKLQEIRGEKDQPKIKIDSVAADGRAMVIHPVSPDNYKVVKDSADKLAQPGVFAVSPESDGRLKLEMPESGAGSGTLTLAFDPSSLFDALLQDVKPDPATRIFARPSLLMPNGGFCLTGDHIGSQVRLSENSPAAIRQLCGGDRNCLETHSGMTFPALQMQGFGEPFFTMSERDVYINIPLIGDIATWKKAAPVIEITDNKSAKSVGTITGSILSAHWSVLGKGNSWYRKGKMTFTVSLKKPDEFKFPPKFTACSFDATPEFLSLGVEGIGTGDGKSVKISGKARCLFTDIDLKMVCMGKVGSVWEEDTAATLKVQYAIKAGKGFGRCDKYGVFEGVLPLSAIRDDFPRKIVWQRAAGDGKIHGTPVTEKTSSIFTRQNIETA